MAIDIRHASQRVATLARAPRPRPIRSSHIGETPLREFGRRILRGYLRKLRKSLDDVHSDHNVEPIHDVRVAMRGLRAALGMFEEAPGFDTKELRRLRRGLRGLARLLGETRDLDVLLLRLEDEAQAGVPDGELAPLRDQLTHDRARSNRRLLHELDRPRTKRLLREVRRVGRGKDASAHGNRAAGAGVLVRHFAGSAMWRRYEEVLAFETAMPQADAQTLHELRIACKHLRYVLEPFVDENAEPHPVVTLLKDAQKQLGALHDAVVAIETVAQSGAHSADLAPLQQHLQADRDRLQAGVMPLWHRLSGPNTRRSLAAFIAAL